MINCVRITGQKFPLSPMTVTLNEEQVHSHWYQTIQFSGIYHHTKFERNRPVNGRMQANIFVCLFVCLFVYIFNKITKGGSSP